MNWKKSFMGLLLILMIFGAFGVYKLVDVKNGLEEVKRENKEMLDKFKTLDSEHEKSKEELKNKESDIKKINEELEKTKKELEEKKKEIVKKREEKELLAAQEASNQTNNDTNQVVADNGYVSNYGISDEEVQRLQDHVNSLTQEQINDSVAQRDEFAASFEVEHGRQPTSGEIQSQWLKDQGLE